MPTSDAVPPRVSAMCVTPFDGGERLDEADLRRVLAFLAGAGVGVYLGSYGTGEGHLLRRDEIRRLYEVGVDEIAGRVPVYAAALGFQATEEVIELALEASAIGVTAVQIHPPRPGPIAIRPTTAELERYYDDVLGAVRTPVVLTNQVVMVGYALPSELIAALVVDHPQVVAVNTSDRDPATLARGARRGRRPGTGVRRRDRSARARARSRRAGHALLRGRPPALAVHRGLRRVRLG